MLPLPAELSRLAVNSKRKNGDGHHQVLSPLHKRRGILLPSIREKISNALHEGDAGTLLELTLDGYGDALLGRASWGDESRKFLKGLPHLLDNIRTLHASISNGELSNVQRILETDPNLIRAKDENGLMAIHLAVSRDQPEIVDYLLEEFTSSCLLLKDQVNWIIYKHKRSIIMLLIVSNQFSLVGLVFTLLLKINSKKFTRSF